MFAPNRRLSTLLLIVPLLAAFWLRVADLSAMPPGLHFDEAENLQRSWRLIQGYGLLPNFEGIPEPFDAAVRAGFLAFTGVTPFTGRLFHAFISVLGVAATIAAARALYRRHPHRDTIAAAAGMTLAALPPAVIIGRAIYAANWIPFTTMMATAALAWAWRAGRPRYYVLAGVFAALAITFYLGGIAFAPALLLALGLLSTARAFRWPRRQHLALLAASGAAALLPWLLMFLWIPNWLSARIEALAVPGFNPLADAPTLMAQVQKSFQPIFIPDTVFFPVYNPYTAAYLNPAQIALFAAGLLFTLRRWRDGISLIPPVYILVMIAPNILSNVPEQPIRMIGIFAPLGLLVGFGAGELLRRSSRRLRPAAAAALVVTFIFTPASTRDHVAYHFNRQPRLLDDPTSVYSWAYYFGLGYADLLRQIQESEQPVYLPVEQLNTNRAAALLRPQAFPTVRAALDGESLPAGRLLRPTASVTYGFPESDRLPLQYALLRPDAGEIVILPPLSLDAAQGLERRLSTEGQDLSTALGWLVGRKLVITADANPFQNAPDLPASTGRLALFDGRLELLALDAPESLTPGQWIPVTLSWRLTERAGADYFVRLQAWDYADTSRGVQKDSEGLILRYLYPTVMWRPGEIITETRWVQMFDDAPPGGYRFAVSVYTYPGPTARPLLSETGAVFDTWALVGRSAIQPEHYTTAGAPAFNIRARFGDSIELIGADYPSPESLRPGEALEMRLYWRVLMPVEASYTLFVHLKAADGTLLSQQDALPYDGQFPTWAWQPGQTIVTTYTFTAPAEQVEAVSLGWYRWPSMERLPVFQDGQPQPDDMLTFRP
ncbi:MAG: hypothetical protein DWB42_02675 [Chloroflexi bacterium]|nr:hypothetical protein [Chloroflexota bacterium]MDL1885620.1 hypothetical protein [Anaerolineae bacterium CFX8]